MKNKKGIAQKNYNPHRQSGAILHINLNPS